LRLGFVRHFRNAAARFCATVNAFFLTTGLDTTGAGFPVPENVALGGGPKTPGCGAGAARHESAVAHDAGGAGGLTRHGDAAEQTRAS
jgi:hypothetical protein